VTCSSIKDPVPDPTAQWWPRCYVTKRILEDCGPVGFPFRKESDDAEDSGCRFICGDESDDYMENAVNSQFVSLGAVLSCDDRILSLLDASPPVAFQWNPASESFENAEFPNLD